jgi:hypothetical protein
MDAEAYRPRATDVWARSPRKANWDRRHASIDKPTGSVRSRRVGLCELQRASDPNKSPVSPALLDKSCEFVKSYGIAKPYLEMPLMSLSARQVVSVAVTAIWMRPLAFSFVSRPPGSATAIVV